MLVLVHVCLCQAPGPHAAAAGSVAAAYLARHGFHVDVYERSEAYAEGTKHMAVGPRSYSVVLNRRSVLELQPSCSKQCLP
jgi:hypothetical protein